MSMKKSYGSLLWKTLQEYAVWEPGSPIQIGDFGNIKEGCFNRIGNISEMITVPEIITRVFTVKQLSLKSEGVIQSTTALGSLLELSFEFSKKYGVVMNANAIEIKTVTSLISLEKTLSSTKEWDRSMYVVTSVRNVNNFALLISSGLNTGVKGSLADVQKFLDGTIDAKSSIGFSGDLSLALLGEKGSLSVKLHQLQSRGNAFKHLESTTEELNSEVLVPLLDPIEE